jgi:hypothetical protein
MSSVTKVSEATDMSWMFNNALSFTQPVGEGGMGNVFADAYAMQIGNKPASLR